MLPGGTNYLRARWFRDRSAHAPVPIWNRQRFAGRGREDPPPTSAGTTLFTFRLSDKSSIQAEYQWRWEDWITLLATEPVMDRYHVLKCTRA